MTEQKKSLQRKFKIRNVFNGCNINYELSIVMSTLAYVN